MAKMNEEVLVIKITTLLPDSSDMTAIMGDENVAALQAVIQEMAGDNRTLVEIEKA
jgi:hypothetical protein